jgi:hypothetical protein
MKFSSILFQLALVLLFSCQPAATPPGPPMDARFRTTPPSKLYFNNIRSTAYTVTTHEATQTNHYQLREWPDNTDAPFLLPVIIDNWLYDQAYLQLRWVALPEEPTLPVRIKAFTKTTEVYFTLEDWTWGQQHDFAQQLYDALLNGQGLALIKSDSTQIPLFGEDTTRRLFRITLQDYRKLTEK